MKCFLAVLAIALISSSMVAQRSSGNTTMDCSKNMFRKECEAAKKGLEDVELKKELEDAELKLRKANALKPEQNLPIPQQGTYQILENGKWNRKTDARGKTDVEVLKDEMKDAAKDVLRDLAIKHLEVPKPYEGFIKASKAASSAEAPTVGPQHLTFAQRQELQKQMEKSYAPYVKAKVEADRAARAAAQRTADMLAAQAAADQAARAAAAAAAAVFTYRPVIRPDSHNGPDTNECGGGYCK